LSQLVVFVFVAFEHLYLRMKRILSLIADP